MKEINVEKSESSELGYVLYEPETLPESLQLIVFLHGAGERGKGSCDWLELVKKNAVPKYIIEGMEIPAVVMCPQCPLEFVWNNIVVTLRSVIDRVAAQYGIPESRISITGLSMGGFGTWEMALTYPGVFKKLAPICGGGMSWRTRELKNDKIWAFHGDNDVTVPVNNSIEMVDAANKNGNNVKLTIFHGVDHNSWDSAYLETKLIDWLLDD